MQNVPEPVRGLLAAVLEALDVPLAQQADDDQARARLLDVRANHAVIAIESVLKHGTEDVEDSARWLRERTAAEPVTFTPWDHPAKEKPVVFEVEDSGADSTGWDPDDPHGDVDAYERGETR